MSISHNTHNQLVHRLGQ